MKRKVLFILILIITLLSNFNISVLATEDVNTETLNVVAKNLSFRDSVCIKFAVDTKDPNTVLLVWSEEAASGLSKDDFLYGTQTSILSTVGYDPELGFDYLIYDYTNLSAKEMTDNVYVRAYLEGTYGNVEKYSILQYAYNMLNRTGEHAIDIKLRNLINTSLEQGAAAQEYFKYKEDRLANDKFYQVQVIGGSLNDGFDKGLYLEGDEVVIKAQEVDYNGVHFAYWKDENNNYISDKIEFTITVSNENKCYTAFYSDFTLDLTFYLNEEEDEYIVGQYRGSSTNIIIPEYYKGLPVTTIDEGAFYYCYEVTTITIPSTITEIRNRAFLDCTGLESVYITDLAAWINIVFGYYVANPLYYADKLYLNNNEITDLVIPDGITEINERAFSYFNNVTNVTIPNSVEIIRREAFSWCPNLTDIFYEGTALEWYNVVKENDWASGTDMTIHFADSGGFVYILNDDGISYGVTYLGEIVDGKIAIPSTYNDLPVTKILDYAFSDRTELTSLTIPSSIINIGREAFDGCIELVSVYITDLAAWLNIDFSFRNANPLYYADRLYLNNIEVTDLVIPDCTTKIKARSFTRYKALTSVTIPSSVVLIGSSAFSNCSNITDIYYEGTALEWSSIQKESDWMYNTNATIHFLDGGSLVYELNEDGISYCVSYLGEMTNGEIVIPSTYNNLPVTNIKKDAFNNRTELTNITIPSSITTIGERAFSGCTGLVSVNITDLAAWLNISFSYSSYNPLYYADRLYLNNIEVTNLVIPDGTTEIKPRNFAGYKALTSLTIPSSVETIGDYSFSNCSNLTDIYYDGTALEWSSIQKESDWIYNTNATIHYLGGGSLIYELNEDGISYSVSYLGEMTNGEIVIPSTYNDLPVTKISNYAFRNRTELTSLTIPSSITTIGDRAFRGCTGLVSVNITDLDAWLNIDYINSVYYHFNNSYKLYLNNVELTNLVIPNCTTEIKPYIFIYCESLTSVTIPSSVASIGEAAFLNCSNLTDIYHYGTTLEWSSIQKESDWMYNTNATIHFLDGGSLVYELNKDGISYSVSYLGEMEDGEIVIPATYNDLPVTNIKDYAFIDRTELTSLTISSSITTIGSQAFYGCTGLVSVYITNLAAWLNISFSSSSHNPLYYADILYLNNIEVTNLVIPDGTTEIKQRNFAGYKALTSITIPSSIETIGDYSLSNCSNLTDIYYDGTILEWLSIKKGNNWMYNTNASIHFTDGGSLVYELNEDGISYCVSYLGEMGDGEIVIPATYNDLPVTNIKDDAFANRTELTNITIPSSIVTIGDYSLSNCSNLTDIYYDGTILEWLSIKKGNNWMYNTNASIHFTDGGSLVYELNEDGMSYSVSYLGEMEDGEIVIPATYNDLPVTNIKDDAFANRTDLTNITIPSSITTIGSQAFSGCTGLVSVNITDLAAWLNIDFYNPTYNPLYYADGLYLNNIEVTNLVIPEGTTEIKEYTFYRCTSITSVTIPTSVASIGKLAFDSCTNLTDIYYEGTTLEWLSIQKGFNWIYNTNTPVHFTDGGSLIYELNEDGISYCVSYLGEVVGGDLVIPATYNDLPVTNIKNDAFTNRTELKNITIPSSITTIGYQAFYGCTGLVSVYITDLAAWLNIDFYNPTYNPLYYADGLYLNNIEVTNLVIPEGTTEIKQNLFYGCSSITRVTIPTSVASIGKSAFNSCTNLTDIYYEGKTLEWLSIQKGNNWIYNTNASIHYNDGGSLIYELNEDGISYCVSYLGEVVGGDLVIPSTYNGLPVTKIKDYTLTNNTDITSVTIPSSIKNIGEQAFSKCTGLVSVYITDLASWLNIDFAFSIYY